MKNLVGGEKEKGHIKELQRKIIAEGREWNGEKWTGYNGREGHQPRRHKTGRNEIKLEFLENELVSVVQSTKTFNLVPKRVLLAQQNFFSMLCN